MGLPLRNILPQVVLIIIGVILLLIIPDQIMDNSSSGIGPRFFPTALTIAIILLSIGSAISNVVKKDLTPVKEEEPNPDKSYLRSGFIFIGVVLWAVLLPFLGFVITTLLATFYFMFIIKNKSKLQLILVPIVFTAVVYYLVNSILKLSFPTGIFL